MTQQARTFQARIDGHPALDATAALLSRAERCLWAEMAKGRKPNDCKSEFLRRFSITARQFNALAVAAKGKASSLKEIGKLRIRELDARIKATLKTIRKLEKRKASAAKLHQKKRRLGLLRDRQKAIRAEMKRPAPALCFGSAKLFNAQHHLEANGYANHAEWQAAWRADRASQFFCLGSKDETGGNQTCTATLAADGSVMLRLRLPDAVWRELGSKKYISLGPVRFGYGHDVVTAAIQAHATGAGEALSWRFVRDAKGWRVFVSLFQALPDAAPDFTRGWSRWPNAGAFLSLSRIWTSRPRRRGFGKKLGRAWRVCFRPSPSTASARCWNAAPHAKSSPCWRLIRPTPHSKAAPASWSATDFPSITQPPLSSAGAP
jgi:hypothetical protein